MADPLRTPQEGRRPAGSSSSNRQLRRVNSEPAEPLLVLLIRLLNALLGPLTHRDWRGQDNLPKSGGVVIVANHISNVDPLALAQYLAYSGRWPRYLAKASLFSIPVVGRALRAIGQIPVHRASGAAGQAVRFADEAIRRGRAVVVYPEGTITLDPDLWPMKGRSGAVRIALTTGCPVIPVGQWGAQDIMWGKKIHLPHLLPRKTLRLVAGPPVPLDDLRDRPATAQVLAEATDRIMDQITALVAELRGESPPAERFDPRTASSAPAGQEKEDPQ
ncbi:MAG TPA: lysophospholipid acyltransferase family protein [Microlunatus sp.]|nr:lysophospholipid acyltransferase family protein [Microlunatus sp.]